MVAELVERGLIAEAGATMLLCVRHHHALLEHVFGLESLSQLPRLDDVGESTELIRERLHEVAEKRTA